jgi:hypothetical protein
MVCAPDWESVADALKWVMATGVSEGDAKADLCRALADRKIDVRVRIASTADHGMRGKVFSDGNVGVPPHLNASDLDWVRSRPLARWSIGPLPGEHYVWHDGWESQPLDLIELSTADVIGILGGERDEKKSTAAAAQETVASRYPGRPSVKAAILKKFRERATDASMCDTLADEARWLLEWAHREHAGEGGLPSTHKVIENQIRGEFRKLRGKLR